MRPKTISKIAFTFLSLAIVFALVTKLDYSQIQNSLSLLLTIDNLVLYVSLAVISFVARSERFFIIHSLNSSANRNFLRAAILAGTSLRNVSMNFIPLRLGELTIPTILKLLKTNENLSSSIQPIWISIIFDIIALLMLVIITFLGTHLYDETLGVAKLSQFSLRENFWLFIGIIFLLFVISIVLIYFTSFTRKILGTPFVNRFSFKFKHFVFDPKAIASLIPDLDFYFTVRILTLSFIIRISKYLALASLFFSLSTSTDPNYRNILIIIIGFICAEFISSLPGSGVMGFGGYELTFQFVLHNLNSDLNCPLNYITSIHLLGLSVEIILALIVVPTSLLFIKLAKPR